MYPRDNVITLVRLRLRQHKGACLTKKKKKKQKIVITLRFGTKVLQGSLTISRDMKTSFLFSANLMKRLARKPESRQTRVTQQTPRSPRTACLFANGYHCPGMGHSPDDYHTESLSYTANSRTGNAVAHRRPFLLCTFVTPSRYLDLSFAPLYRSFAQYLYTCILHTCGFLVAVLKH